MKVEVSALTVDGEEMIDIGRRNKENFWHSRWTIDEARELRKKLAVVLE